MSKTLVNRVHPERPGFTAASSQHWPEGISDQRATSRRCIPNLQILPGRHCADGILNIGLTSSRPMCAVSAVYTKIEPHANLVGLLFRSMHFILSVKSFWVLRFNIKKFTKMTKHIDSFYYINQNK